MKKKMLTLLATVGMVSTSLVYAEQASEKWALSEKQNPPSAVQKFSREEAKNDQVIRRFLKEVIIEGNLDILDKLITPNSTYILIGKPLFHSKEKEDAKSIALSESTKMDVGLLHKAFSGLQLIIDDVIPSGDKLVYRWTIKGTQTGNFGSIPATGKEVTIPGVIICRMENGKIAQVWEIFDSWGLLRQLGTIPEESIPQMMNDE